MSRFPKYIIAGTRRESATHIRKKNILHIRKPQYEKINTLYIIIPTLNKYKNTYKRVGDHNRYGNKNK